MHDFCSFFDIAEQDLTDEEKDHESDTVAGWLTDMTDQMPAVGQTVALAQLELEVIKSMQNVLNV